LACKAATAGLARRLSTLMIGTLMFAILSILSVQLYATERSYATGAEYL
jgi:hypothetical protein